MMKKTLTTLVLLLLAVIGMRAQDYSLCMDSQGRDGKYQVRVTAILDKKQNQTATDYIKRMAVDGVMFRGVAAAKGYPSQAPLITDPTVAQTKADFFNAFNANKGYERYVSLDKQNMVVTKLPKNKFEVVAILQVDKEQLIAFLESNGIISGFGDLW